MKTKPKLKRDSDWYWRPWKDTKRKERRKNESKLSTHPSAYGGRRKEHNRRKNKRKKQGSRSQPSYLDHLVVFYDPHGSYGVPILKPPAHWGYIYIYIYIYMVLIDVEKGKRWMVEPMNPVSRGCPLRTQKEHLLSPLRGLIATFYIWMKSLRG